jgi:hypothetical protein
MREVLSMTHPLTIEVSEEAFVHLQDQAVQLGQTPEALVQEWVAQRILEQHVQKVLARWRSETAAVSSSTQRLAHPAYREMIALGPAAVPFLLRDLERTGDGHLAKALSSLTGAQPVPEADRGKVRLVAEAWLRWGRGQGLVR